MQASPKANAKAIEAQFRRLFAPSLEREDFLVELRALEVKDRGYLSTWLGYFDRDHVWELALAAADLSGKAKGVYVTLNPLHPDLLARRANRVEKAGKGEGANDGHVLRRVFLPVDFDRGEGVTGISSTDAERAVIKEAAQRCMAVMMERGWPRPEAMDSGNGFHLLWRVDLPAEDNGLVGYVLDAMAVEFSVPGAGVDIKNRNPARIWKLPGTLAAKGDSLPNRPWRLASLFESPTESVVVTREQLEEYLGRVQPSGEAASFDYSGDEGVGLPPPVEYTPFDIETWIAKFLPAATGPSSWKGGGRLWEFTCWQNDQHERAFVGNQPDGAIVAGCHHNSCKGWGWKDLREKFEPAAERQRPPSSGGPPSGGRALQEWVSELNSRHAVIGNLGGKCRVIERVYDSVLRRQRIVKQSFEDFRNRYSNVLVAAGVDANGNVKYSRGGVAWLDSTGRSQYDTLVFAPGATAEEIPGAFNLWQGFGCEARQGDCSRYLEHVYNNICGGVDEYYQYLMGWMALMVQRPASPGYAAVVLRGRKGVGKSIFVKQLGALFGQHYMQVSDAKHLVGNFNAHLRDTVLLFADEAFFAGDKRHESILKTIVTEEHLVIEAKGVDAEVSPSCLHLIMASNSEWVVPASSDERRYFVLDVKDNKMQDTDYFGAIAKEMDGGGREALLWMLQRHDVSNFNVRRPIRTEALRSQIRLSLPVDAEWWLGRLRDGQLVVGQGGWDAPVRASSLFDSYCVYAGKVGNRRAKEIEFGFFLRKMAPGLKRVKRMFQWEERLPNGNVVERREKAWGYSFPELELCRGVWEGQFGAEDWEDGVEAEGDGLEVPF